MEKSFQYDLNMLSNRNQWSLLHLSCDVKNIPLTKALIAAGVNVNSLRNGGVMPLDEAIHINNLEGQVGVTTIKVARQRGM